MRELVGNIWDHWQKKWLVVTTNIGWKPTPEPGDVGAKVGPNPMGAGLAKDLAERVPSAPSFYGQWCFKYKALTPTVWHPEGFVLLPTKALDPEKPWLSWRAKSNIVLIERSLRELAAMKLPDRARLSEIYKGAPIDNDEVLVPLVGCKNGQLTEKQVLPLMQEILDDRFVLVREPPVAHPF